MRNFILAAAVVFGILGVTLYGQQRPAAAPVSPRFEYGRLMVFGVYFAFVTPGGTLNPAQLAGRPKDGKEATPTEAYATLGPSASPTRHSRRQKKGRPRRLH